MLEKLSRDAAQRPSNLLTDFFDGNVEAWGLVAARFGGVRRKFSITMNGHWTGSLLKLEERFVFNDGQIDNRIWEFSFDGERSFTGFCDELSGAAEGTVSNDELKMSYLFNLPIGKRVVPVRFDDRMYRIDDRTIANRAVMYKFGLRLGEVNAVFRK